jgi:hypothetical protein
MCSTPQEPASTNEQKHETLFSCLINIFCNISVKWSKWHSWAHLWWWSPFMTATAHRRQNQCQEIQTRRHNPCQEILSRRHNLHPENSHKKTQPMSRNSDKTM